MTQKRSSRILIALIIAALMLVPAAVASADSHGGDMMGPEPPGKSMKPAGKSGMPPMEPSGMVGPADPPPIAIMGPRLSPPAIPHSMVFEDNVLIPGGVPAQSLEADAADGGRAQEEPGRGIRQTETGISSGITLYDLPNVCNNFNMQDQWPSTEAKTDIWTDWYAGWAPFAIDNGYYQAKNVTFSREQVVGPGNQFGDDQHSAKIASNQAYAGGFGSPIIPVPEGYEGGQAYVHVDYLIWDHDTGGGMGDGWDYDWASLGVKADAAGDYATYVNGYVRGEWAQMVNVIELGHAKDIMVLLQGHSPGAFNSNIYFDNVQIAFIDAHGNGAYLADCTLADSVE